MLCIPMRSGHEMLTLYFSSLGGPGAVSIESVPGPVTSNLCFYILWDLWVTKCIPVRLGPKMSTHYFSCSGGPSEVSIKSASGHVTSNLCFSIR
jgi:hypothetical protein